MGLRKIGIKLVNKFYGKRLIDKLKKRKKNVSQVRATKGSVESITFDEFFFF